MLQHIRTDHIKVMRIKIKFVLVGIILLENEDNECGPAGGSNVLLDPNWPVERVANWLIIPQSASTRGQNRPLAPSLGGGGPRSIVFRPTGRLYPAIVSHHAINTALLQKPQIPNGQWRGSPIGQKFPNRHELKGKTGPQHPPPGS